MDILATRLKDRPWIQKLLTEASKLTVPLLTPEPHKLAGGLTAQQRREMLSATKKYATANFDSPLEIENQTRRIMKWIAVIEEGVFQEGERLGATDVTPKQRLQLIQECVDNVEASVYSLCGELDERQLKSASKIANLAGQGASEFRKTIFKLLADVKLEAATEAASGIAAIAPVASTVMKYATQKVLDPKTENNETAAEPAPAAMEATAEMATPVRTRWSKRLRAAHATSASVLPILLVLGGIAALPIAASAATEEVNIAARVRSADVLPSDAHAHHAPDRTTTNLTRLQNILGASRRG